MQCLNFALEWNYIRFRTIYSNHNGLLLVGGNMSRNTKTPNQTIQRLIINTKTKEAQKSSFSRIPNNMTT